ncbi:MAG: RluA family pseudouridine synthase [Myxococcota bacterium]
MASPPPGCDPDSIVLTFPVAREHAGLRLDRFLQTRIPRLSRTRANRIVKACAYRADGTRRRASERVRAGEIVLIVRPPMNEPPTPQSYGVLYEDEDVLAVHKPSGLPMHPTATYHRNTLTHLLSRDYGEDAPQFAHRLDRETSGVVVCGKHGVAEVALKRCFERREAAKSYLAIVRGVPPEAGEIDRPMGSAPGGPHVRMAVREDGVEAITRFEVLERRETASLVRLFPKTGRQHQLRVHLAFLGHPIIGDKLYGPDAEAPFLEIIEEGWSDDLLRRLGHARHALHAETLEVPHPRTGERMRLVADLPWDLLALWDAVDEVLAGDPVLNWRDLLQPRWQAEERPRLGDEPNSGGQDTDLL